LADKNNMSDAGKKMLDNFVLTFEKFQVATAFRFQF